jgi:hypothetical protein
MAGQGIWNAVRLAAFTDQKPFIFHVFQGLFEGQAEIFTLDIKGINQVTPRNGNPDLGQGAQNGFFIGKGHGGDYILISHKCHAGILYLLSRQEKRQTPKDKGAY